MINFRPPEDPLPISDWLLLRALVAFRAARRWLANRLSKYADRP